MMILDRQRLAGDGNNPGRKMLMWEPAWGDEMEVPPALSGHPQSPQVYALGTGNAMLTHTGTWCEDWPAHCVSGLGGRGVRDHSGVALLKCSVSSQKCFLLLCRFCGTLSMFSAQNF